MKYYDPSVTYFTYILKHLLKSEVFSIFFMSSPPISSPLSSTSRYSLRAPPTSPLSIQILHAESKAHLVPHPEALPDPTRATVEAESVVARLPG